MDNHSYTYPNRNGLGCFGLELTWILLTFVSILFDIPILRPILAFPLLLFLPGFLLLSLFRLNRLEMAEKAVFSVGLSIFLLMLYGLLIDSVYPLVGYSTPLSQNSVVITLVLVLLVLSLATYKVNKEAFVIHRSRLSFNGTEKLVMMAPLLFPLLSIIGMHIMNTSSDNLVLITLLTLIPFYVMLLTLFREQIPKRTYPLIIYLIAISVSMMLALRSAHVIGADTHEEFLFFTKTLEAGQFSISGDSSLDVCLSISILPTIYQSLTGIDSEPLFRIIYPVVFSFAPVVIYILSRRYVSSGYAFLASFLFISQYFFIFAEAQSRTSIGVLFFALMLLTMTHTSIGSIRTTSLMIILGLSMVVSHYSTTYVSFLLLAASWLIMQIVKRKVLQASQSGLSPQMMDDPAGSPMFRRTITWTFLTLIFAVILLWYGRITGAAFENAVNFIGNTLGRLNDFFLAESRGGAAAALGGGGAFESAPATIEFAVTYVCFFLIGVGVLSVIRKYRDTVLPYSDSTGLSFLKSKIDFVHAVLALACGMLLAAVVLVPGLGGYSPERVFILALVPLAPFFLFGGMALVQRTRINPAIPFLLVLIPLFLCNTGVMYNIFGVPKAITLNSEGDAYDNMYVYDAEVAAANWIVDYYNFEVAWRAGRIDVYTDLPGRFRLVSQAGIDRYVNIYSSTFEKGNPNWGCIWFRSANVVNGYLIDWDNKKHFISKYEHLFRDRVQIYSNGRSEIWGGEELDF